MPQNMLICIDSSAFILGLQGNDSSAVKLLESISSDLKLTLPRLVAQEVTRNLNTTQQVRQFYRLFQNYDFAQIRAEASIISDERELGVTLALLLTADRIDDTRDEEE